MLKCKVCLAFENWGNQRERTNIARRVYLYAMHKSHRRYPNRRQIVELRRWNRPTEVIEVDAWRVLIVEVYIRGIVNHFCDFKRDQHLPVGQEWQFFASYQVQSVIDIRQVFDDNYGTAGLYQRVVLVIRCGVAASRSNLVSVLRRRRCVSRSAQLLFQPHRQLREDVGSRKRRIGVRVRSPGPRPPI